MKKNVRSSKVSQVSGEIIQLRSRRGLAFKDALSNSSVSEIFAKHAPEYRERVFSPLTTLFALLSQVLSPDRSCRNTVAQVNADRIAQGLLPASPDTGAYCKARDRLPEGLVQEFVLQTGKEMETSVPRAWLWKNRHVKVADGSTITMADTAANRKEFMQDTPIKSDDSTCPLSRLVVVFSLVTGCVMDVAVGAYRGKGSGELGLIRKLFNTFISGDVLLVDALYSPYFLVWMFQKMGVDMIVREHKQRFSRCPVLRSLGKGDKIFVWKKPPNIPDWMGKFFYGLLPEQVHIRQITITINKPGFRSKQVILMTTLLNQKFASADEIGQLYRQRWDAELNLRTLKRVMNMDYIPCKTPAMVRKEIFATMLAYNAIRRLMGQAAYEHQIRPTQISFKGTVQTLNQYKALWRTDVLNNSEQVLGFLFNAIVRHRIRNRPDRVEPRRLKRRKDSNFQRLNKPRAEARQIEVKLAAA